MAREHSGSQPPARRNTTAQRPAPATAMHEQPSSPLERRSSGAVETVQQLTERLEGLRRETDEAERQLAEEDEEFNNKRQSFQADKEKVKQELEEKDAKSKDIKKEANGLERQSAHAQNKKQAKERLLRQKQSERKRMEDDLIRWTREIEHNEASVMRMRDEESQVRADHVQKLAELQSQHDRELANNKTVEGELHRTGLRVKDLEAQRKAEQSSGKDDDHTSQEWREADEKVTNEHFQRLQLQYVRTFERLGQAQIILAQSQQTLDYLQQSQSTQSSVYSPTPSLESAPLRSANLRRRPVPHFRTLDSPTNSFPLTTGASHPGSIASTSPSLSAATPWLSMNRITHRDSAPRSSLSHSDIEQLTGGAPMSPTAQDLLPAGLLGDDPTEEKRSHGGLDERGSDDSNSGSQSRIGFNLADQAAVGHPIGDRSSGAFSGIDQIPGGFPTGENWVGNLNTDDKLPGLGAIQERRASGFSAHANRNMGVDHPHSPVSVSSRSPSAFASPRDSAQNLHQTAPDNVVDSDRRSIRSTGSSRGAHSRFSSIFNFGRTRTNTNPESDGPPVLGSLSASQTQSMPKHDQPTQDPSEVQRRAGSRSTQFFSNVLGRSSTRNTGEGSADSSLTNLLRQRTKEDLRERWPYPFGPDHRPRSPRPLSTHSSELPRPTSDALHNAFNPIMARQSSSLSGDWLGMTSTHSFSRHPSRRASEQYGQSGGFPYGETVLESDPPDMPSEPVTPPQDPIGTKPSKKSQSAAPKLNPAAKSFNIFSRDKKSEKVEKSEKGEKTKAKSKGREKESTATAEDEREEPFTDDSPSDSRFSRDTPSLHTTDSQTDHGEALDRPDSRTPSLSLVPTESQTPSSAGKESKWHHKITRKGSLSNFAHLSSLTPKGSVKGKAGGLFSSRKNNEMSTPTSEATPTREEIDDDGSDVLSKSGELPNEGRSKNTGLSWSSITKRMNWKGDKAPSTSEASLGSEATDDDDAEGAQEA